MRCQERVYYIASHSLYWDRSILIYTYIVAIANQRYIYEYFFEKHEYTLGAPWVQARWVVLVVVIIIRNQVVEHTPVRAINVAWQVPNDTAIIDLMTWCLSILASVSNPSPPSPPSLPPLQIQHCAIRIREDLVVPKLFPCRFWTCSTHSNF